MQKIIRINARSRRSMFSRERAKLQVRQKKADKEYWDSQHTMARDLGQRIRSEKTARREDWLAGPLAPDRDTGLDRGSVGAFTGQVLKVWSRPQATRTDKKPDIGNRGNIVQGDRVVVIKGRYQGQIGEVLEADHKEGSVTVQGLNIIDVKNPIYSPEEQRARKIQAVEKPFPLDDVRLVFRPEGADKDVIVRYIRKGKLQHWSQHEPHATRPEYSRWIDGTDIEIPWPAETVPEHHRYAGDTPREPVDEQSYLPALLQEPFPTSIADELIPQYAKDRQRHEEEYVTRKILEDARSAWYDGRKLLSPTAQKLEQLARERQERTEVKSAGQILEQIRQEVAREPRI